MWVTTEETEKIWYINTWYWLRFNSLWIKSYAPSYLASTIDIVASFTEYVLPLVADWSWKSKFNELWNVNIGCFGCGRSVSFVSMKTTSDMFGLPVAWSCTQRSAICMHLVTSTDEFELANASSIKSKALPSFHRFHAWYTFLLERTPNTSKWERGM